MPDSERDGERDGLSDAEYDAQKARVRATFDRWIPRLRLQAQRILFCWRRGCGPERPTGEVAFECDTDWRYLSVRITCYLETIADQEDAGLEGLVVHELVHVHLGELRVEDASGNYQAHEERVTEQLARAVLDTYRAGREDGPPQEEQSP